jgi:hypothetical protein
LTQRGEEGKEVHAFHASAHRRLIGQRARAGFVGPMTRDASPAGRAIVKHRPQVQAGNASGRMRVAWPVGKASFNITDRGREFGPKSKSMFAPCLVARAAWLGIARGARTYGDHA